APYKPVDTNPTKQPAPSPDFLKSLEEANEREKVSEEEVKQTSQLVDQATAELQDRITKAGCTVDTTTPTPEIAKYNPDTKTISLNLKRIAQIVKYVEEKRPGEGNDVVKATLSEEVTHAEIDNELKEGGENPVKYYAKVFIGLTNEQFKILRDVYGNLDTQIADSKEGPVPLDKQAALYGAEWLRIERMLARGEKIPQEFSVSSQKMARLLDEMNKWRIQHPSEKTIVP
ncbi:MAG TPA: hypothetical protein VG733_13105, partial [Chthoniobacteraceae bacterium]|nr:hypothetical protein [Chthoniobacteraceae bacterium]